MPPSFSIMPPSFAIMPPSFAIMPPSFAIITPLLAIIPQKYKIAPTSKFKTVSHYQYLQNTKHGGFVFFKVVFFDILQNQQEQE